MKEGPSESASRSRLQTTPSCCGKEPSVVSIGVKVRGPPRAGRDQKGEDPWTSVEASWPRDLSSKPEASRSSGISPLDTWIRGGWRPA